MTSSIGSTTPRFSIDLNSVSAAQRHAAVFKKVDSNGDGKIDGSELQAMATGSKNDADSAAILKAIDTNGDGGIDEAENDAFMTKMESQGSGRMQPSGSRPQGPPPGGQSGSASENNAKIFDELDTNKDGKVSLQELMAAAGDDSDDSSIQDLLKSIDTDSDGSISNDEFDTFMTKLEEEMQAFTQSIQSYDEEGNENSNDRGRNLDSVV
jgi:Ca2+-binding EF-hand superfamily protein